MEPEKDEKEYFNLQSTLGTIRGEVVVAPNGKKIVKFLGIPYAQQPVGELRFKPLKPLDLPLGTKELPFLALKYGFASLQEAPTPISTVLPTGEGCIYLNIFSPLENIENNERRVLFHIHSGGFYVFSGSDPVFDMTSFVARHDCVGVSINYRLGLLGFLSMPPLIEDNLGLKDQQVALKWVHQHIKSFGGNPEKITIYGCSAGGASCHYHCLNKKSVGLFERAVLSSGLINDRWACATPEVQQKKVKWALSQLKCPSKLSPEKTLEFLMKLDGSNFVKASSDSNFGRLLLRAPCPVSTFCENGKYSLIPLEKKPLLVGATAEECNLLPEMIAPRTKGAPGMTRKRQQVADLLTETEVFAPMRNFFDEINLKSPDYPLVTYLFDYETKTRGPAVIAGDLIPEWMGKFHSLDIPFFMHQFCPSAQHLPSTTEQDNLVNESMAELLEKFMTQDIDKFDLPVYSKDSRKISRITSEGIVCEDYEFQKCSSSWAMAKIVSSIMLLKLFPNRF